MRFSQKVQEEIRYFDTNNKNRAFIIECFQEGGTVSNPKKGYHLEFKLDKYKAIELIHVLFKFKLNPKKILKKSQAVVYFKDANAVADILNIMGAHKSLLLMEEARVEKDMRNQVNRKVNFETANLKKTTQAAIEHIEAIECVGLLNLPKHLQEVARIRLENEEASLAEIGEMLDPPIGKSGVSHRLKKICQIARERGENNCKNAKL